MNSFSTHMQASQPRGPLSLRRTLPKVEVGALNHASCCGDAKRGPVPVVLSNCLASVQAQWARTRRFQGM